MARLETKRLILRPWREEDRAPFAAMNRDARVREFFPSLQTEAESNASVDRAMAHFARHGYGFWAAESREDGRFVGFIGLAVVPFEAGFTPAVEIGWRLAQEFWGRGLATEGAREALRFGFEKLGLEEIVSFTVTANLRSRRVMEKLRMRHDEAGDFDHPMIAEGHSMRRHVLYRLRAADWLLQGK